MTIDSFMTSRISIFVRSASLKVNLEVDGVHFVSSPEVSFEFFRSKTVSRPVDNISGLADNLDTCKSFQHIRSVLFSLCTSTGKSNGNIKIALS